MPSDPFLTARSGRRTRPARAAFAVGVLGTATLAASIGMLLSAGGEPGDTRRSSEATAGALSPPPRQTARLRATEAVTVQVTRSTVLATVRAAAPRYASPGRLATGTVAASWYERPSVLPVIATTTPDWIEVRLAQRPNESTAWLPASEVTLSRTPYQIVIDLATTKLSLYDDGRLVFTAPVGVGTKDDPTPTGQYFVAFDERPPNPGYGPFILVTSAHSPTISDWEGSGDAVIGIHGPLGEDSQIGTSGAKISHGCIRLHDQALEKLTLVPPGTPIDVVG
jgi:lipoprotein-anchoring transpeptidase ErfK/SrfK